MINIIQCSWNCIASTQRLVASVKLDSRDWVVNVRKINGRKFFQSRKRAGCVLSKAVFLKEGIKTNSVPRSRYVARRKITLFRSVPHILSEPVQDRVRSETGVVSALYTNCVIYIPPRGCYIRPLSPQNFFHHVESVRIRGARKREKSSEKFPPSRQLAS